MAWHSSKEKVSSLDLEKKSFVASMHSTMEALLFTSAYLMKNNFKGKPIKGLSKEFAK